MPGRIAGVEPKPFPFTGDSCCAALGLVGVLPCPAVRICFLKASFVITNIFIRFAVSNYKCRMISKRFGRKPKGKDNTGRSTKVTSIMISQDLKDRLSELKDAYECCYNETVTYDQMLARWADNVGRFDPKVKTVFDEKSKRESFELHSLTVAPKYTDDATAEAEAGNTIRIGAAMKNSDEGKAKEDAERQLLTEKKERCIGIIKAADPKRPTAPWWATDEWYVNPETGKYYAVLKGKEGKSDYARTNGEILGQIFCPEDVLLSEECGFLRIKVTDS